MESSRSFQNPCVCCAESVAGTGQVVRTEGGRGCVQSAPRASWALTWSPIDWVTVCPFVLVPSVEPCPSNL